MCTTADAQDKSKPAQPDEVVSLHLWQGTRQHGEDDGNEAGKTHEGRGACSLSGQRLGVRSLCDPCRLQDVVEVPQDSGHLGSAPAELAQHPARRGLMELGLLLEDLPVEANKVIGLLDGLNVRPVVNGSCPKHLLQFLLK
eukprot:CAMPEP_0179107378 /NCGR_PEP_ID=MMETSP0796-20121207/49973_1 /TAXON_ID=73915 /ORGANISM="Pyrodinium bahamense, Strain pbaha01" /LENGTH=140 /DNA_ID=CAMNT_0020805435 /DNA_START=161 /DNA_END=583 /DNA_ORIENTATION=-